MEITSQSIQVSSKITSEFDIENLWNGSTERRWEVGFDYKTKVYLTNTERKYFLEEVAKGKVIIQIGDFTLTSKFQYIIPIHPEYKLYKVKEVKDEEGKTLAFKEV